MPQKLYIYSGQDRQLWEGTGEIHLHVTATQKLVNFSNSTYKPKGYNLLYFH